MGECTLTSVTCATKCATDLWGRKAATLLLPQPLLKLPLGLLHLLHVLPVQHVLRLQERRRKGSAGDERTLTTGGTFACSPSKANVALPVRVSRSMYPIHLTQTPFKMKEESKWTCASHGETRQGGDTHMRRSPEACAHFARFSLKVNILLRGTAFHSLSVQSPRDELQ